MARIREGERKAAEDGIEFYRESEFGRTIYKVPCCECGTIKEVWAYGRDKRYVCDACKKKRAYENKQVEKALFGVLEEKGEHRFNQALDRIQAQVKDFEAYDKAVRGARKAQGKYGSIPEAMVAVELLKLGYPFIPQQKVGRYHVDFYIPKIKMVIEVDGAVYHQNPHGGERDARIQFALGFDVRIVHIPAELIAKDIQKLGLIIDAQQKNRNHGRFF